MDISVKDIPNVILSCFVLHNFCEKNKAEVDANAVEQPIIEERSCINKIDKSYSYTTPLVTKVRDSITDYFNEYL